MVNTPCYFDERRFRIRLAEKGCKTLVDLARLSGFSESLIGQVARGRIPSTKTREAIAAILGATVAELWPTVPQ